jgi:hypothetical protein
VTSADFGKNGSFAEITQTAASSDAGERFRRDRHADRAETWPKHRFFRALRSKLVDLPNRVSRKIKGL